MALTYSTEAPGHDCTCQREAQRYTTLWLYLLHVSAPRRASTMAAVAWALYLPQMPQESPA